MKSVAAFSSSCSVNFTSKKKPMRYSGSKGQVIAVVDVLEYKMRPSNINIPYSSNVHDSRTLQNNDQRQTRQSQQHPQNDLINSILLLTSITSSSNDPYSYPPLSTLLLQEQHLARQLQLAFRMISSQDTAPPDHSDGSGERERASGTTEERHVENMQLLISQPLPNDVLFGRGRPLQAHHGNLRFHRIVNKFRDAYKTARKDDKATVTATVLAEISTPDPLPISATTSTQEEAATATGQDVPTHQEERPNRGGRFLKRTDSGNHWIEVSTAEAMEKASHALRGLPRRSTLGRDSFTASASSTTASGTPSSPAASPSSAASAGVFPRDVASDIDVGSASSPPRKKRRSSKSQSQTQGPAMTRNAEETAANVASRMGSSSHGEIPGIQNILAMFGTTIRPPLEGTMGNNLPSEQLALAMARQQQMQRQVQQYLAQQQQQQQQLLQQQQQRDRLALVERARQEMERQVFIETMAQKMVQREQEQMQAQQQLLRDQAVRQILLRQQQQAQLSIPQMEQNRQLSQLISPQASSNSLVASVFQGNVASQQEQEQQQHHQQQLLQRLQQQQLQQDSVLQQLLFGTAGPPRQQQAGQRNDGKEDDTKPPAS